MSNHLIDSKIELPLLDALGTCRKELIIVAGAHDFMTAHTDEGPAVSFFLPAEYMKNEADGVTVCQHKDGTYSVLFYKGEKEVDRISHCAKEQLYDTWWEHTACAIQMPLLATKFAPGRIVSTPGAMEKFYGFEIRHALARHVNGDWGEVEKDSQKLNAKALVDGSRILSAYTYRGHKMWIITDAVGMDGKRAATTVLQPWEY